MPKVQFAANIGSRDVQALSLDRFGLTFADCTIGSVVDLDNDTIASIKKQCGEGSIGAVEATKPEPKKSDADKK
jgi:hypothetical protein